MMLGDGFWTTDNFLWMTHDGAVDHRGNTSSQTRHVVDFHVAKAEIEKARREQHIKSFDAGAEYRKGYYETIRADERERIARDFVAWWTYRSILGTPLKESILEMILQKGPHAPLQEQNPLEKIAPDQVFTEGEVAKRFNALVDAVNRHESLLGLPAVGSRLPGGTKIGNAISLPNGGTWERIQ